MAMHKVKIIQTFRTIREIVIEVDSVDSESAVEDVASGAVDVPAFGDENWRTGWELMDEKVESP